jgi:hypothetical protein
MQGVDQFGVRPNTITESIKTKCFQSRCSLSSSNHVSRRLSKEPDEPRTFLRVRLPMIHLTPETLVSYLSREGHVEWFR